MPSQKAPALTRRAFIIGSASLFVSQANASPNSGNYSFRALRDHAITACQKYHVPPRLFLFLIYYESRWNVYAKSPKGACGLTQLMPSTASSLGVTDVWNPVQNIHGGALYLRMQYEEFRNWKLALAAYNAGARRVRDYGGIPPFEETQNYVSRICSASNSCG